MHMEHLTLHRSAAVVGGGPAGLMAAETMARSGLPVTVYEHKRSAARKFVLAGRSGLNLTHDEDLETLLSRYGDLHSSIEAAIRAFPPSAVREWAEELGHTTFVGTTGRVFPEEMRSTPLLRSWLRRLDELGVELRTGHRFVGWTEDGSLRFDSSTGLVEVTADATVMAMGGASWPSTGSDAGWVEPLREAGIEVNSLVASNCGVIIEWSEHFGPRFAGTPLKNVTLTVGGASRRGDPVVTSTGLESGPVYALVPEIRDQLAGPGVIVYADMQPDRSHAQLVAHLTSKRRPKDSLSTWLRRAGLEPVTIGLLREATGNNVPTNADELAELLKAAPIPITGLSSLDRAISSAGGVAMSELDDSFMLQKMPDTYVIGEMLDWDAPTGGYLLQACFSMGRQAGAAAVTRALA